MMGEGRGDALVTIAAAYFLPRHSLASRAK
jgi:hypothetical protein